MVSQVKLIAEPWDVGEGGYQVGNFPPLWTEWNGKYRDTVRDFWRGQPADAARVRLPADRLIRPVRDQRPAPGRVDQLRHLPRRVHPGRPGELQRQAQRGQRRGQPGRHRRQPLLELRRRGPGRGPRGHRAARPAAAQLPGHPVPVAGHPDAAGRRRDRPHPGGQQQRLLPGQRDLLGGLVPRGRRARPAGLHPAAGPAAAAPPGVPPPPLLPGRVRGTATATGGTRHRLAHPGGRRDDRGGLAGLLREVGRGLPQRVGDHRARPARRPGDRQEVPAAVQRGRRADHVHHPRGRGWRLPPTGRS